MFKNLFRRTQKQTYEIDKPQHLFSDDVTKNIVKIIKNTIELKPSKTKDSHVYTVNNSIILSINKLLKEDNNSNTDKKIKKNFIDEINKLLTIFINLQTQQSTSRNNISKTESFKKELQNSFRLLLQNSNYFNQLKISKLGENFSFDYTLPQLIKSTYNQKTKKSNNKNNTLSFEKLKHSLQDLNNGNSNINPVFSDEIAQKILAILGDPYDTINNKYKLDSNKYTRIYRLMNEYFSQSLNNAKKLDRKKKLDSEYINAPITLGMLRNFKNTLTNPKIFNQNIMRKNGMFILHFFPDIPVFSDKTAQEIPDKPVFSDEIANEILDILGHPEDVSENATNYKLNKEQIKSIYNLLYENQPKTTKNNKKMIKQSDLDNFFNVLEKYNSNSEIIRESEIIKKIAESLNNPKFFNQEILKKNNTGIITLRYIPSKSESTKNSNNVVPPSAPPLYTQFEQFKQFESPPPYDNINKKNSYNPSSFNPNPGSVERETPICVKSFNEAVDLVNRGSKNFYKNSDIFPPESKLNIPNPIPNNPSTNNSSTNNPSTNMSSSKTQEPGSSFSSVRRVSRKNPNTLKSPPSFSIKRSGNGNGSGNGGRKSKRTRINISNNNSTSSTSITV